MFNYPNGKKFNNLNKLIKEDKSINLKASRTAANRGMNLEESINLSNDFYIENNIALITKRPTPINVVKVDYSKGCKIVEAYFEKQSTTDYNGLYKTKYVDFEAKVTKSKTSFPLANIYKHQIEHLKRVLLLGGIAFFIIQFDFYDEVYVLDANYIIDFYENGDRKSIPYPVVKEKGILVKQGFIPRLAYLDAVDKLYFSV